MIGKMLKKITKMKKIYANLEHQHQQLSQQENRIVGMDMDAGLVALFQQPGLIRSMKKSADTHHNTVHQQCSKEQQNMVYI